MGMRCDLGVTAEQERAPARQGGGRPDLLTLAAFALFATLVAANFVAVRFTNRELPPFWGAGTRFGAAGMLFLAYAVARRLAAPRGRGLAGALFYGVFQFGLGYALAYWALLEVPAGLAAVILASIPLFTLLFAAAARLERLRLGAIVGAAIAMAGVAVVSGEQALGGIPVASLLATLGSAASFSLAGVVVKASPPLPLATINAVGMLTGAALLLALSRALGEVWSPPVERATWAAQLYLLLAGSVAMFALFLFVLRRWTASAVAYQAVLSPVIAIALSAWLLGEPVTAGLLLGSPLVLAGVYLGAMRAAG